MTRPLWESALHVWRRRGDAYAAERVRWLTALLE